MMMRKIKTMRHARVGKVSDHRTICPRKSFEFPEENISPIVPLGSALYESMTSSLTTC
jgi:hypothetical protein